MSPAARATGPRIHPTLGDQLRRVGLTPSTPPPDVDAWDDLLSLVSARYSQQDIETHALTREDSLTGLPNRAALQELLWVALMRSDTRVAVLTIGLDGFKGINEALGHATGDLLLVRVAQVLTDAVRPQDVVSRQGGDEFVVLCVDCDEDAAEMLARRIGGILDSPIEVGTDEVVISASIGVAVAREGSSGADLLQDADTAMYEAKAHGRAQYAVFDERMRSAVRHQVLTENALYRAIGDRQLVTWFQPVVSLDSGRLSGFEALVRWDRPGRGLVSPDEFVPVVERSRLVAALDGWMLRHACQAATGWPDPSLSVSVNMSTRALSDPRLAYTVAAVLERTGMSPSRLVVELTERTLMSDDPSVTATVARLRALGVRLAIDDFGTGYSSLSYLRRLPVSILKIDRSFVVDVDTDARAASIVGAILAMGRALDLSVVVEGVESPGQRRRLQELGCDLVQGFLFSPPIPESEVPGFVAATQIPTPRGTGRHAPEASPQGERPSSERPSSERRTSPAR